MRLSEATELMGEDIKLDCPHPHILMRPHPWRRLKTQSSERIVPLVGASISAAKRATETTFNKFLLTRYCDEFRCKGNAASVALNKWFSSQVPSGCVVRSFRHSYRDWLRAVECPPDIINRHGGWSIGGVGEAYRDGNPLDFSMRWLQIF